MPDPPELPPETERNRLFARAFVIGSEEAMEALDEVGRGFQAFQADVYTLDDVESQGGGGTVELRQRIDASRAAFLEQVETLERIIRHEIRR